MGLKDLQYIADTAFRWVFVFLEKIHYIGERYLIKLLWDNYTFDIFKNYMKKSF